MPLLEWTTLTLDEIKYCEFDFDHAATTRFTLWLRANDSDGPAAQRQAVGGVLYDLEVGCGEPVIP